MIRSQERLRIPGRNHGKEIPIAQKTRARFSRTTVILAEKYHSGRIEQLFSFLEIRFEIPVVIFMGADHNQLNIVSNNPISKQK